MNSSFLTSKILHADIFSDQLELVCKWIEENHSIQLDINTIRNKSNILLENIVNESIKIKTIRDLKEKLSYAAYNTNEPQFVIFLSAEKMTHAAQNAILKTIEEPPRNTLILLVTPYPGKLLSTIQSRCQKIILSSQHANEQQISSEYENIIAKLLSDSIAEKIELSEKYKERESALQLCHNLILQLHAQQKSEKSQQNREKIRALMRELVTASQRLEQNCNVRLTLEVAFLSA